MPHISELKQSKFLTKADVGRGVLVTIRQCFQENVAKEGAPSEMKWCLGFDEQEKPMVLNSTNAMLIASIIGSENTDDWVGHKVVLYDDPSISFQGKLTGGIRARAPRQAVPAPQAQPARGPLGKVRTDVPAAPPVNVVPTVDPLPADPPDDLPF